MITENTTIITPSGGQFCGVSFKGDVTGWEKGVLAFASLRGLKTLRVKGDVVQLNDGSEWRLDQCRIEPYEVRRRRRSPRR